MVSCEGLSWGEAERIVAKVAGESAKKERRLLGAMDPKHGGRGEAERQAKMMVARLCEGGHRNGRIGR